MARGVDELIEHVLVQITYCGVRGANSTDFKRMVDEYHAQRKLHDDELALTQPLTSVSTFPQTDDVFYQRVWAWLMSHPDVLVGDDLRFRFLTLAEFEACEGGAPVPDRILVRDENVESIPIEENIPASRRPKKRVYNKVAQVSQVAKDKAAANAKSSIPRIHVREDRMWKALTGHGKDYKRVPFYEFELLSYIAFAGPQGIQQPHLCVASNQDKRSVPKRTDNLVSRGYIEKHGVLAHDRKTRTSQLVLKKYALEARRAQLASDSDNNYRWIFLDKSLVYGAFLDFLVTALQAKPNGAIAMDDLFRQLGIYNNRLSNWQQKLIRRATRRLAQIGVIRKLRARDPYFKQRFHRSIVLARVPSAADRDAFSKFTSQADIEILRQNGRSVEQAANAIDQGHTLDETRDSGEEEEADDEEDITDIILERDTKRLCAPSWIPEMPIPLQLFHTIDDAGEGGSPTLILLTKIFGGIWKRPMEMALMNLTNYWDLFQPLHLYHLAILRDTVTLEGKKGSVFAYRTFDHYQAAVEKGSAYWDAIRSKEPYKGMQSRLGEKPHLDAWGFPVVDPNSLCEGTGQMSLKEAKSQMKVPRFVPGKGRAHPMGPISDKGRRIGRPPKGDMSRREAKEQKNLRIWVEEIWKQARKVAQKEANSLRGDDVEDESSDTDATEAAAEATTPLPKPSVPPRRAGRPVKRKMPRKRGRKSKDAQDVASVDSPSGWRDTASMVNEPRWGQFGTEPTPPDRSLNLGPNGNQTNDETGVSNNHMTRAINEVPSSSLQTSNAHNDPTSQAIPQPGMLKRKLDASGLHDQEIPAIRDSAEGVTVADQSTAHRQHISNKRPRMAVSTVEQTQTHKNQPRVSSKRLPRTVPSDQDTSMGRGAAHVQGSQSQSNETVSQSITDSRLQEPGGDVTRNTKIRRKRRPDAPIDEDRALEIAVKLAARREPGCYLNPVGLEIKGKGRGSGRPRAQKALLAIKSDLLGMTDVTKQWFVVEEGQQHKAAHESATLRRLMREGLAMIDPDRKFSSKAMSELESMDSMRMRPRRTTETGDVRSPEAAAEESPSRVPHLPNVPSQSTNGTNGAAPDSSMLPAQGAMAFDSQAQLHGVLPKEHDGSHKQAKIINGPSAHVQGVTRKVARTADRRAGVQLGGGSVGMIRSHIILEILKLNDGIFPGGHYLLPIFRTYWHKHHNAKITPDTSTIKAAVKNLVQQGKINRLIFHFVSQRNGLSHNLGILAMPGISSHAPAVRALQLSMIDQFPNLYFPKSVAHLVPEQLVKWRAAQVGPLERHPDVLVHRDQDYYKVQDLAKLAKIDGVMDEKIKESIRRLKEKRTQVKALREAARKAKKADRGGRPIRQSNEQPTRRLSRTATNVASGMFLYKPNKNTFVRYSSLRVTPKTSDQQAAQDSGRRNARQRPATFYRSHALPHCFMPVQYAPVQSLSRDDIINYRSYRPTKHVFVSLTHPTIKLDTNSGTFGTFFTQELYAYDVRVLDEECQQKMWENAMPHCLENILDHAPHFRIGPWLERNDPVQADFMRQISRVCRAELSHINNSTHVVYHADGYGSHKNFTPKLRIPRFINHKLPPSRFTECQNLEKVSVGQQHASAQARAQSQMILWDHSDSQHFTPTLEPPDVDDDGEEDWLEMHPRKRARLDPSSIVKVKKPDGRKSIPFERDVIRSLTTERGVNVATRRKRKNPQKPRFKFGPRNPKFIIDAKSMKKVLYAAAAVRMLAGGETNRINWTIMHYIFRDYPHLDLMRMKNRLNWMESNYAETCHKLSDQFRDAFILAYEKDEVPTLDFQDLENYDWDYIVEWAQCNLHVTSDWAPDLPKRRNDLEADFTLKVHPAKYLSKSRERIFRYDEMIGKRESILHALPWSCSMRPEVRLPKRPDTMQRADEQLTKSWLRANTATPAMVYDRELATQKLRQIPTDLLTICMRKLIKDGIFAHRSKNKALLPGRNYKFSNNFEKTLSGDIAPDSICRAAQYKLQLDHEFEATQVDAAGDITMSGNTGPKAIPRASEIEDNIHSSVAMVLMGLVAQHRVRIQAKLHQHSDNTPFTRPPGLYISRWGTQRGRYGIRGITRNFFDFRVEAIPTELYQPSLPSLTPPPISADSQRFISSDTRMVRSSALRDLEIMPMWRTLHDGLLRHWWARYVSGLLQCMATRTTLTPERMVTYFNNYIDICEVEMCLDWLERNGLVRKTGLGDYYQLTENWWAALGTDDSDLAVNRDGWIRDLVRVVEPGESHQTHPKSVPASVLYGAKRSA